MGFNYKGQIQDSIPDCNFYHWGTFNKNNKNKRRSLKMLWSSVEAVVFIVQFSINPFTCLWWECSQMRTCFKVLFAFCPVTLGDLLPVSPGSYSDRRLNQTQRYDDVAKSLWWWNVTDYQEKRRLVTISNVCTLHTVTSYFLLQQWSLQHGSHFNKQSDAAFTHVDDEGWWCSSESNRSLVDLHPVSSQLLCSSCLSQCSDELKSYRHLKLLTISHNRSAK